MIRIIDYGAGNLRNVKKAFDFLGYEADFAARPEELEDASHIVLPGVGAFGENMDALRRTGFAAVLPNIIEDGTPFFGICLGMQMLFDESLEMGRHKGLGIFPGTIAPMTSPTLKIPHMGWNTITGSDEVFFGQSPGKAYVYFVHSYFMPLDGLPPENRAALCEYTEPFVAAVRRGNCVAAQFHPEKSGQAGIEMLRRFAEGGRRSAQC